MRRWVVSGLVLIFLVACTPDEWSNRLPYAGPVEKGIEKGQLLPGTPIQYVGKSADSAQVLIEDKQATKKIGDSMDWRAEVLPAVDVDQTYRVALITEDVLHVAGTARIIVRDPKPQPEPANTAASMHFKLPVGYHVDQETSIPGTTITYVGKTDQGAELGNLEGYAYRKVGDSILWQGKLREGVWIGLDLRTMLITDTTLDVVGTADLWIEPQR
jgi:hypothetical protein